MVCEKTLWKGHRADFYGPWKMAFIEQLIAKLFIKRYQNRASDNMTVTEEL